MPRHTSSDDLNVEAITRIILRPIGSGLPLGFFAFGVGTVVLAAQELHWITTAETRTVAIIALAFVAPLEFLPCLLAFFSRDTAGGTAMGLFSAGWVVIVLQQWHAGAEAQSTALAIFLVMDSLAIVSLAIVAFKGKPLLSFLLGLAAIRFLCTASVQFGAAKQLNLAAGAIGLLTGVFAVYGGLAFLLEDVRQQTVLPVFRRGSAKESLEGNLASQVERTSKEAGVRQQL